MKDKPKYIVTSVSVGSIRKTRIVKRFGRIIIPKSISMDISLTITSHCDVSKIDVTHIIKSLLKLNLP